MEFLSFDDGTIKNPAYREDTESLLATRNIQRRRKRQFIDNANLIFPSYTQNLIEPQNAPFSCNPSKVHFSNYDVGKEYNITIALVNKTTVPKTFRVMPVLPKYANVLQFVYEVPPRISPGLSWEVTLRFRPRENVDFSTALYFKTEEGYFAVPVTTARKTFLFSVRPKVIDFGTVVVGEEQTRHITLENKGALSGTVVVGGAFKSLLEQKHTNAVNGKKVSFFRISPQQYKMEVQPFSTLDVALNFSPLNAVKIETDIILTDKTNSQESFTIPITGVSTELPVYLTSDRIDFGACFFNEQYWDEVTVVNRTNITAIADFHVPAPLSSVISISPSRACVQPGEQYTVQVTFHTNEKMPRAFLSTVECVVRGQTLPLPLTICADLSERAPQVASSNFDVGKLLLNTSQVVDVPVTNAASVVQLVGFDSLPTWIRSSQDVIEIAPGETAVFRLTVEPPQKGRFSQRLRVINEFGDAQLITVSGQGVAASFSMSSRTLLFPPCNLGCSVTATTVLLNTSERAGEFHFAVPNAHFRVSPNAGILPPGGSIPVAIIFDAPAEFETTETAQQPAASQRPVKGTKKDTPAVAARDSVVVQKRAMYDDWESGTDERLWSKHRQFRIKCDINDGSDDSFFLAVRCCAIKPLICLEDAAPDEKKPAGDVQASTALNNTRQSPRKTMAPAEDAEVAESEPKTGFEAFINYGKVPIHCVSLRQYTIISEESEGCSIRAPPMNPLSAFSVLSYAFDGIPSEHGSTVCIAFQPRKYGKFSETLKFELISQSGNVTSVCVRVYGICNPTQLAITMADAPSSPEKDQVDSVSHLLFHCTQRNDSAKKVLNFSNVGSSPLAVVINDTADTAASRGINGARQAFLVHPRIFTVQPYSKQVVNVVFTPTDEGSQCHRLSIVASGENREMLLDGRCVRGVIYALVPHASPGNGKVVAISFTDEVGCRPEFPVSLTFEEGESKIIVIGSVVNGQSGEYELLNWEQTQPMAAHPDWNVTPLSHVIVPGKETQLCIQRVERDSGEAHPGALASGDGALFPLRFTLVLKGEAANASLQRALFIVCASA